MADANWREQASPLHASGFPSTLERWKVIRFILPGPPGHWFRLHGEHQTESCSNATQRLSGAEGGGADEDVGLMCEQTPGKMKMKKALMPPITLMILLMSGTNMAKSSVTVIHNTVTT